MTERFKTPISVHLFVFESDRVLLLRRFNTGFEDGNYSVPAGCIDGNETLTNAIIREAKEEAGLILKPEWIKVTSVLHRKASQNSWEMIAFFFTASCYEGEVKNCEPNKCDDLQFFPLSKLPDNLIPYVRKGLENTLQGVFFSEFGWGKDRQEKNEKTR